jgi:eukaryotic-like serine/threonine-protein kinase
MPVPVTRDEFFDLVRKSGVLDDDRVATFAQVADVSIVGFDKPQVLAQRMIRDGLLTTFQAKQLLQGKYRRFLLNGKYRLLEPIGAGGMGQVFLCSHIYMNRLVALKVLPIDKLQDRSMVERFYREARAAAALDHPNIVRAFDIDREEGESGQTTLHYLVMEFVDGASLQEIVARKGPMTPLRSAHYIKQAAAGLQHAHESGLVHRDIKPGNLLLDRNGTVKVLDLGLARFFQQGKDNVTERYDEKNAILGTADYLAPEQARGETVDIRADIYSLGATLYFLLAGKAPFEEGSITQKLLWSQTKAPKPIRELRPEVPAELAAVLEKMMAKDANDRYQTPQALIDALVPWTDISIPPPAPEEMPRRSLAASTSGPQSNAPMVPSTPSPRSVPTDLVRSRPPSTPLRLSDPAATSPKPAPKTQTSANGPRSRSLAPIVRGPAPAPASGRRKKATPKPSGMSTGIILAIAGGGGALVILGFVITLLIMRKPHVTTQADSTPSTPSGTATAQAASQAPVAGIIQADQAAKYVGRRATVEMKVMRSAKATTSERYFLNSKVDYRAADNFTVTFTKATLDQLTSKGIANERALESRTIRVSGLIVLYNNLPQIEVSSADQIQIVGR